MLFDKKCSAPLLPQPLPERGACGVGTLAVEKVDPAPVALVAVQGAQAVAVQRFLTKRKSSPESFDSRLLRMPVVGVEPTRVIRTRDFESPSSAIPTHRHGKITKLLYRILCQKSRQKIKGETCPRRPAFFAPGGGQNPRRAVYWGQMFYTTGGFSCEKL